MVNFNCFHSFSTEIMNCRAYFTVVRIFNEWRHFKYVQTNVNTLECCRNGGCRLPTGVGIQCACARHRPQPCSGGISKRYSLNKNMPRKYKIPFHVICNPHPWVPVYMAWLIPWIFDGAVPKIWRVAAYTCNKQSLAASHS